jgi:hypothetical protein
MTNELTYPYRYHAYGLDIVSQLPVTGFEQAVVSEPDVTIRLGDVPENLPDAVNKGVLYQSTEREFLLHVDQVARYHVCNGKEIIIQILGKASQGEVSAFISGTSFGALLHQRRMLPLHASTVLYMNKCLMFAGFSGSGKSTLAASVVQAGGILIADDVSVIDFSKDNPAVYPAFPFIKIWEDSLKHLGISAEGLEPVREELRKFYLPVSSFNRSTVPLHRIFIIASHNRDEVETKDLKGVDKFRALKKHTYLFQGIPKTRMERNHFVLLNRLATQVPVTFLTRPNSNINTERLLKEINEILFMG